jgi:superfamily II DNA or RNA helicase
MPTGGGKTVVFSFLAKHFIQFGRVMILVHRKKLALQAKAKIEEICGCHCGLEMGENKSNENQTGLFHKDKPPVVVSTIQTHSAGGRDGGGRIAKFDPSEFVLVIIDEAHHAISKSWERSIKYYLSNPDLKILGVTATPNRTDEQALGQIFEEVAFNYGMEDFINRGWLVPVDGQEKELEGLDFSKCKTTAGDINMADLASVVESKKNLFGVAYETIECAGDLRGIGFAATVAQAKCISDICNGHRRGKSAWIYSKTPDEDRELILEKFRHGDIQYLWNCGIFTEGFDDANIGFVSMARPTKSDSLYTQMMGRGIRPHESIAHGLNNLTHPAFRRMAINRSKKPSCLIMDFVGNNGHHRIVTIYDILGGAVSDRATENAIAFARKDGGRHRVNKVLNEEEQKIKQEEIRLERKKKDDQAADENAKLPVKAKYKTVKFNPFEVLGIKPVEHTGLAARMDEGKYLSPKQLGILRREGYDPSKLKYARAVQLVGIICSRYYNKLCSLKQADILKRFDCNVNVSREDASKMLDQIASNGWQRPLKFIGLEAFKLPPRKPKVEA